MKKMRVLAAVSVLTIVMFFIPLWSAQSADLKAGVKYGGVKEVKVLSGASSSAVFIAYSARAQLINKIPGIRSACIAGSITSNLDMLEKGQGDISHSSTGIMLDAAKGEGAFKGKTFKNIAFLSVDEGPRPAIMFVRGDSKIRSVQDFKGKHIATSIRGSGVANIWLKMMACHGITPENITKSGGRFSFLSNADINQGLRDKTIDVVLGSSGYYEANPTHLELIKTIGLRLIPLDPKALDQYLKDEPMAMKITVRPGLYNNTEPYQTWAAELQTIVVRRDMPDDLVYDILKALYSKAGRTSLLDSYPAALPFVLENGLQGAIKEIPVHPGAAKFYKENGVVAGKAFLWPTTKEDSLNKYGGKWDWPWK